METDSGLVVARGQGKGEMGSEYLMGTGFSFEVMKCFETRESWWLHSIVTELNVTESYSSNNYMLCEFHLNYYFKAKKKKIMNIGNS